MARFSQDGSSFKTQQWSQKFMWIYRVNQKLGCSGYSLESKDFNHSQLFNDAYVEVIGSQMLQNV